MGLITDEERHAQVAEIWNQATEDITNALKESLNEENLVYMMAILVPAVLQIRHGLVWLNGDPSVIIDLPIKANFGRVLPFWNTLYQRMEPVKVW